MTKTTNEPLRKWVLLTGGSQGIGLAFARACLASDLAVALVALDDEHLSAARAAFAEQPVELLGLDLTAKDSVDRILAWLKSLRIEPTYLINNAGFGRGGLIENTPWSHYSAMLELNNRVVVELCYKLQATLTRNGGAILNMSSMEATLPLPYKTVYTGTKGFVYNFSLALREELRYHGVSVTVLCPGPVITNEAGLRRLESQGWRARTMVKMPDEIATAGLKGMLTGKDVVRPGFMVKFSVVLSYLMPRKIRMSLLEKIFSRYRNEVTAQDSVSAQSAAASAES